MSGDEKVFSLDELALQDGGKAKRSYIAYQGVVYDVSDSALWKQGTHMRRHHAGRDLTTEMQGAPHGAEVLGRYRRVGVLKEPGNVTASAGMPHPEAPAGPEAVSGHVAASGIEVDAIRAAPAGREAASDGEIDSGREAASVLERVLERHPFLKRHPHPAVVHFPIGFMYAALIFAAIFLLSGRAACGRSLVVTLLAGVAVSPFAIGSGFLSWWVNYMARPIRQIRIKIIASTAMFVLGLTALVWYFVRPDVMYDRSVTGALYFTLLFTLVPLVSVVGFFGGTLVYPLEKRKSPVPPQSLDKK
jgi:predicted heme/steroid binding protein/uncharacterized membrane protein